MRRVLYVLPILVLLLFTGCVNDPKNLESMSQELKGVRQKLEQSLIEIAELKELNQELQNRVKAFEYNDAVSFKGIVKMTVMVLEKQPGTELYPYYILVTNKDVDHNTPLLLTTDSKQIYDEVVIGKEHTFRVFVINIVQREDSRIRYTFMIIN